MRRLFHDNIIKNQNRIDGLDGQQDHIVQTENVEETKKATTALFNKVDEIRMEIEADSLLDFNGKMKYLRGLNDVLTTFEVLARTDDDVQPAQIIQLVPAYATAMKFSQTGSSIKPLISSTPPGVGAALLSTIIFQDMPGYAESKELLERRKLEVNPDQIMANLKNKPNIEGADRLIKQVALRNPEDVYTYAQAGDQLADRIQNSGSFPCKNDRQTGADEYRAYVLSFPR